MRKKRDVPAPIARDRRKESRVQEEDKVILEVLSGTAAAGPKTTMNALTRDLSPGGVRIMTNIALPVGTLVKMEIALSRRRRLLQVVGAVRWYRSVYEDALYEMGIEFTQIRPEDKMVLIEHAYRNSKGH